eukprot:5866093-Amphidinium_carterae.1
MPTCDPGRACFVCQAGDLYDRYPESWPGGEGPPNLESFAQKLLEQGLLRISQHVAATLLAPSSRL